MKLRLPAPLTSSAFAGALALTVTACSGASGQGGGGGVGTSATGASCEVKLDGAAPVLAAAQPYAPPRSSIELTTRIAEPELLKLLEKELPVELAREKKVSVGPAGKADYVVTRGKPVLNATKDELEVRVPINAEIDVCKPFAGMCIKYGHCEPAFEAVFTVSTKVGEDYALPKPQGELSATKRCVIGIDVTPQILSEARREVEKVEAQIARRMPSVKRDAEQLWARVQAPLKLPDQSCVRFEPERITYRAPTKASGYFQGSLGIEGALMPSDSCDAGKQTSKLGPVARASAENGAATAWLPTRVGMAQVKDELSRKLGGIVDESNEVAALDVQPSDGKLALGLTLRGKHCGTVWLTAKPIAGSNGDSVALSEVALVNPAAIGDTVFAERLVAYVARAGSVSLPLDERGAKKLSDEWLAKAQGELPKGAKLSFDLPAEAPGTAEKKAVVAVTPEGLVVAVPFGTRGRVEGVGALLGR